MFAFNPSREALDAPNIDAGSFVELRYWAYAWGVSIGELLYAVSTVGTNKVALRGFLRSPAVKDVGVT